MGFGNGLTYKLTEPTESLSFNIVSQYLLLLKLFCRLLKIIKDVIIAISFTNLTGMIPQSIQTYKIPDKKDIGLCSEI